MLWSWNSDAFGTSYANEYVDGKKNPLEFNLRFPGQYFYKESSQHYNYFRDYEPATGRYLESDPIGLRGGVNTFGYVSNNSLTKVDLKGLIIWQGKGWISGLAMGIGTQQGVFTLTSECMDGKQAVARVLVYGAIASYGVLPADLSNITFEINDFRTVVRPWQFTGPFSYSSYGANIWGFDYFSSTQLFLNGFKANNINATNGFDIGLTFDIIGTGLVLAPTEVKDCCSK